MPTCPGCGASYADEFRFCPHCAHPRPETPKIQVEVTEALAPNACPHCKRVDSVQKLSSIRAGGTQRTSGVSHTSGSSSVDGNTTYYGSNNARVGTGQVLIVCGTPLLILFIAVFVITAILTWLDKPSSKATEARNEESMRQYRLEHSAQQKALAIWNQLYYCHRDDIVYMPGTKYTAAPKDTVALCYTLAQQKSG